MTFGAGMLLSPLWSWWLARHTLYADHRPSRRILIEAPWRRRLVDVHRRAAPELRSRSRMVTGRGDIIFERLPIRGSRGRTTIQEIGFFGLNEVKHVDRLLGQPGQ